MLVRTPLVVSALFASFFTLTFGLAPAQTLTPLCRPSVTSPIVVDSHEQIMEAGLRAEPPLVNTGGFGFAWPDTQMGAIKTAGAYQFFTSDGALHPPQVWQGYRAGNNKYGSVTTTTGTLDNPLGAGDPQDVSISPNPDPGVNPNYSSYGYMGGGSVYQVPAAMTGAGNLLVTYHAELPNYALLGLAESTDNGRHWTDLGEIVRLNQAYKPGLTFAEIGDRSPRSLARRQILLLIFSRPARYEPEHDPCLRCARTGAPLTPGCLRVQPTPCHSIPEVLSAQLVPAARGRRSLHRP